MRSIPFLRRSICFVFIVVLVFLAESFAAAEGVDINDTRLLAQPAISKSHIAFIYAGDLWAADLDGKNVRRLTADEGLEANPQFSPDGSLIAFTAVKRRTFFPSSSAAQRSPA